MAKASAPLRLLVVSHAADGTGAPISTLALCKAWAARGDVELEILLRRNGPLRPAFEAIAPTFVARMHPERFGIGDALHTMGQGHFKLALQGLRNSDRPYVQNAEDRRKFARLAAHYDAFAPDAIYVSTTHCGDAIAPLGLTAPILTHVREMQQVIAALDTERRDFALKQSAMFAAVSAPVQKTLVETWRVAPARIFVEPPALDVTDMVAKANVDGETFKAPVIVGVGSLIARKGPDLFLEIAAKSKAKGLPFKFIWLGDGEMKETLLGATYQLDLEDMLDWRGQVDNPYPILKSAAALALTSIEDPHPRAMLEAAALSTPSVAFAGTGGADNFLPAYNAGLLVEKPNTSAFLDALVSVSEKRVDTGPLHTRFDVHSSAERLLSRFKALNA